VQKIKQVGIETQTKLAVELADAHCHADMLGSDAIKDAVAFGVRTIITNGIDTKSNFKSIEISDGKNVFPALGISPDKAVVLPDNELEFNINMIRANAGSIVSIGEIGLDSKVAGGELGLARQKVVFEKFVDLALELGLPVSVHSRGAIKEVIDILEGKGMKRVHLHYFEGGEDEARRIAKLGWVISVPPVESSKRARAIKEMPLGQIMAESDAPAIGDNPKSVEKSVRTIAALKGIDFARAAEITRENTRTFFNLKPKTILRI
jgi:TatD DNase family protein